MMMLDGRLDVRRWPELAMEVKRRAAFVDAPAVVLAFADQICLLPQILAVLPDPNVPRLGVHGDPPRITETISPRLPSNVLLAVKGIVLGNGVRPALVGMVHIEAQQLREHLAHFLPAAVGVGIPPPFSASPI